MYQQWERTAVKDRSMQRSPNPFASLLHLNYAHLFFIPKQYGCRLFAVRT